jgi:hypothetical protein
MRLHFALDSGAHSIYNTHVITHKKGRRGHYGNVIRKYDYYDSPEFADYLDGYVDYVKRYGYLFDFHVTIDAIGHPGRTKEITKHLIQRGLKPIPVFHYGASYDFLEWMMAECGYVGIGGYAQATSRSDFEHHCGRIFDMAGKDRSVKVHAFALLSISFMQRFPWYSVDATTAGQHARFGGLMIPRMTKKNGKVHYDYGDVAPIGVLSDRRTDHHNHILHFTGGTYQAMLAEYVETLGITVAELRTSFLAREIVNEIFMYRMQQQIVRERGHGVKIYRSGKFAMPPSGVIPMMQALDRAGVADYYYMGTYFRLDGLRQFNKLFDEPPFVGVREFQRERTNGRDGLSSVRSRVRPIFRVFAKPGNDPNPHPHMLSG